MKTNFAMLLAALAATRASAQQACTVTQENAPSLTWRQCSEGGTCTDVTGGLVIDANWRWTHTVEGYDNCYSGAEWDATLCPDGETCAANCCVDGADYEATYGVTTSGDSVSIRLVTENESGTNVGARLYLTESESKYQMFNLLGNEFSFTVDSSQVPCGLNGALYFISMDADGGASKFPTNAAGAKYGTGYCDAQCARDLKWINGIGNVDGWAPWGPETPDVGIGNMGACCAEMDMWEANNAATSYTPHPCSDNAYHSCVDPDCGGTFADDRYGGSCDADGCDFNPYRQGNPDFYGPGAGFTIDSSQPITVVTQFHAEGGALSEITRYYIQGGEVIQNSESTIEGTSGNSLNDEFCTAQKTAFDEEQNQFMDFGGMAGMGGALDAGMVLALSIWSDAYANMLWLDSTYPVDESGPGTERGPCSPDNRTPTELASSHPDATVVFSDIRFGPIGSTYVQGE
ncbi:glycoside hydrolase family 7 protein [Sodiomyces alcalophilus JCM 7366]|uniref:glycoside hydrolase family 7 protein n=1 Tax=Sodiomyces alcalophilus JCM 7366 TaxID=591952 RepID=UPI0039B4B532